MKSSALELHGKAYPSAATSQGFHVADGTIEAIKWLALALMTLDHINKFLFNEKLPCIFELGRLAMPLFAFVLAYNLARPDAMENGSYIRTMKRLAIVGVIASPFFISLGGIAWGWYPLNIMFMLLVATVTLYLAGQQSWPCNAVGAVVFLVGGGLVEFLWFAVAFCLCAWWYCKTTSKVALLFWLLATFSLQIVNHNSWALAAMPVIFCAPLVNVPMPRFRHLFYAYYPAHLAVLLLITQFLK